MRFDKVITLIAVTYTKDALRQEVAIPTERQVFANEFSLTAAEFYDAGRSGLKPERQYQIHSIDYEEEELLSVDGLQFKIIRVDRRGEWTRLICQRNVGNTAAETVS